MWSHFSVPHTESVSPRGKRFSTQMTSRTTLGALGPNHPRPRVHLLHRYSIVGIYRIMEVAQLNRRLISLSSCGKSKSPFAMHTCSRTVVSRLQRKSYLKGVSAAKCIDDSQVFLTAEDGQKERGRCDLHHVAYSA